ncbi:MAG TPA: hypothetical protein VET27_25265 [Mycobacterium sp.]|nr:hypothetical protein [Mycobacterium sp.]
MVGDCCELGGSEDFVDLSALYRVWTKWAESNNTGKGMSQNKFRAALKSLYLQNVRPGQKKMPDGKPGKWVVVWAIKRAEWVHHDRGINGDARGMAGPRPNRRMGSAGRADAVWSAGRPKRVTNQPCKWSWWW